MEGTRRPSSDNASSIRGSSRAYERLDPHVNGSQERLARGPGPSGREPRPYVRDLISNGGQNGPRRPSTSSSVEGTADINTPAPPVSSEQPRSVKANRHQSKIVLHTTPRRSSVTRGEKSNSFLQSAQFLHFTSFGGKNHYPLINEETSIGRNNNNHIVFEDLKISKYHAIVKRVESNGEVAYFIKDKNSSNGVRVNNLTLAPDTLHRLVDGDEVSIGSVTLIFVDEHSDGDPKSVLNSTMAAYAAGNSRDSMMHATLKNRRSRIQSVYMTKEAEENLKLVTILPSESKYEETVVIADEIEDEDLDFVPVSEVADTAAGIAALREDYEKLRLAYELSKIAVANDITPLLAKSMDLMFDLLPVDRGVVLLVDEATRNLATHYVQLREGSGRDGKEILLSSTILRKVFDSRVSLISKDATEDPTLGYAASVRHGQIRSVICVPLIAHSEVYGILHLDSRDRRSFSKKDVSLIKAISNQTAMAIENMILMREVETKARITEQLSRFLPPHVVDKMAERGNLIQKGGREMMGTIIFVDIRGFTNLSESLGPVEVVNMLNDYFERLVRVVFKYEGVVDKYIGDALMALFGTLDDEVDSEYRAVAAALEMVETIREMNDLRRRMGKDPIKIGVGVNTGNLLAGFIGCAQRLEYTCIGDTVNTSSRICDFASSDQVLISEYTYEKVKDWVEIEQVGFKEFKGKTKKVMIYQVLSIDKK